MHRIGRTGRNGKAGRAASLVTEDEIRTLHKAEAYVQLLQTVISNLPIGLCLLSVRGEINMVNRRFSMDLELPETGTTGRNLSQFLPQPCKGMDFCHSADYKVMNRSGKHLLLSSLELLLPNHEPLPAQQHAVSCAG